MKNCTAGYIRVSTAHQAEEGVSLDAQRNRIDAYCRLYGLNLIETIEDAGISGKNITGRPGIQKVLELVSERRINHLVILKLDRLARNVKECCEIAEHLEKKGVSLHSVTERIDTGSANGRLFFVVLSAMAAWEREINGERVKAALLHKKLNNERYCRYAPYGFAFSDDGKLVENHGEKELIKRICKLRERGLSIRKIACNLNELGYRNRMGNPLGYTFVIKILQKARDQLQHPHP